MKEKYHHLKFKYEVGNFYNRIYYQYYTMEKKVSKALTVLYGYNYVYQLSFFSIQRFPKLYHP